MSLASEGRRLPFPPLDHLEGQWSGTVGVRGVEDGISPPPLSQVPIPLPSYSPTSIKGIVLHGEVSALLANGAIELAPPSRGFYSRLFVVWKTSGSWSPVIDLSRLNEFVLQTRFKMESSQSVLSSIWRSD